MKRRDFFVNSACAAALISNPFFGVFSENSKIKIGIITQLFRSSGYGSFKNSKSITHYATFKEAYADLLENKIDVLITSPKMLSVFKPEFSLVDAHVSESEDIKRKWLQDSHAFASNFHAQNSLKSDFVGSLSSLKIRLSNLGLQELSQWKGRQKAVAVAATGVDAIIFDHMGFYVRQEPSMLKLSMQLVELSQNHLNLTNAYAPALFLNAFEQNRKIDIHPCQPPFQNLVMVDNLSGAGTPIELVYKNDSQEIEKLRSSLQSSLSQDEHFQKVALSAILDLPNFTFSDQLPSALSTEVASYGQIHLKALKGHFEVNQAFMNNFEHLKGKS